MNEASGCSFFTVFATTEETVRQLTVSNLHQLQTSETFSICFLLNKDIIVCINVKFQNSFIL